MILRDLHLPEYEPRRYPRQYVNMVNLPYKRPEYQPTDLISADNAYLAAAHCQGCQDPKCVEGCPAGIDIPGFMRRMEARNYAGAARLIREKNPFGEVCGLLCTPNRTCQKDCSRRDFTGLPVRIAELQRWVCVEAGSDGWIKSDRSASQLKVAVLGGGPSGLTCAYYLALVNYEVTVFAAQPRAGGNLLSIAESDELVQEAARREIESMLSAGITFKGNWSPANELELKQLTNNFQAVYLPYTDLDINDSVYKPFFGENWRGTINPQTGQVADQQGVFVGEEYHMNGVSVVEAVASGRKSACAIDIYLRSR
jgi:NADPH-dependent glutamate synthase beta subunit-like oxidoreductase